MSAKDYRIIEKVYENKSEFVPQILWETEMEHQSWFERVVLRQKAKVKIEGGWRDMCGSYSAYHGFGMYPKFDTLEEAKKFLVEYKRGFGPIKTIIHELK